METQIPIQQWQRNTSGWVTLVIDRSYPSPMGATYAPGECAAFPADEAALMRGAGVARRPDEPAPVKPKDLAPMRVRFLAGFHHRDLSAAYGPPDRAVVPAHVAQWAIARGVAVLDDGVETCVDGREALLAKARARRLVRQGGQR